MGMKKKLLIVTGPVHSGTSLLAKIVHEQFTPMSPPLSINTKYNYKGYENKLFHDTILNLFEKTNIILDSTNFLNIDSIPSPKDYQKILRTYTNNKTFIVPKVFKAPYMCFLLSLFKDQFDSYILYTTRNEKDNIKSLMIRDNMTENNAKLLINECKKHLKYNLQFFKNIQEISFEKLLVEDKKEINKIKKLIDKWRK